MSLIKRLVKGSPLTFQEGDDNLDYLEGLSISTSATFNNFTSSYNTGSFSGSFTGTLIGTASFAISASWAPIPVYTRRSDTSGSFTYCGIALSGSSESSPVWDITRIDIPLSGSALSQYAYNVAWTNRYTETYT